MIGEHDHNSVGMEGTMTFSEISDFAQVIGAFGIIASLVFVGLQLRQGMRQLERSEGNASQAQASAIRLAMLTNRDVAELLTADADNAELDAADERRLSAFFSEMIFLAWNGWRRQQTVAGFENTFTRAMAPVVRATMSSARAVLWWQRTRKQFPEDFVADLEANAPLLASAGAVAASEMKP
jgi:hypothetical protein